MIPGCGRSDAVTGCEKTSEQSRRTRQSPLLQLEQKPLAVEPTAIADESPVAADHAMTGHDDADRISPVGCTDSAHGRGFPNRLCQLEIASGLAIGDRPERGPHSMLKAVPIGAIGTVNAVRFRAKYSSSCSTTSSKPESARGPKTSPGASSESPIYNPLRTPSAFTNVRSPIGDSSRKWLGICFQCTFSFRISRRSRQ